MSFHGYVYVTGSNPPPGKQVPSSVPGHTGTVSDEGLGINTYIAGGVGPSGSVETRAILRDVNGNQVGVFTEGVYAIAVQDELTQNILKSILVELKLIKLHLETMTGEEVAAEEIDE